MTHDETLRTNAEALRDLAEQPQRRLPYIDVVGRFVVGIAYEAAHQSEANPKRAEPPEPPEPDQ